MCDDLIGKVMSEGLEKSFPQKRYKMASKYMENKTNITNHYGNVK